ncbi:MAG: hypothetical protein ACLFTK_16230, partial [Anaerolineales bacterium]
SFSTKASGIVKYLEKPKRHRQSPCSRAQFRAASYNVERLALFSQSKWVVIPAHYTHQALDMISGNIERKTDTIQALK